MKCEKIKRRPDGTRYVTRRPVRKRAMPSLLAAVKARREQSLARERAGMSTTDDDGGSEVTGTGFSTFMDAENERFKQLRLKKKHAEWWEWLIESHERNLKSEARDRALLEENKRLKSDGFFKDALITGLKFDLDEAKKAAEKQLTEAKIEAEKQLHMAKKDAEKQMNEKDNQIMRQGNKIDELDNQIMRQGNKIDELGQQIVQLREEIQQLKEELAEQKQNTAEEIRRVKEDAAAEIQRVNDALEEQTQKVEGMQRSAMMAQSAFKMPSRRKGCALIGASTSSSSFRSSPSTAGHISPVHSVAAVDSSFGKHKVTGGVSSSVDPMSLFAQLQPFIDDKSSSSNSGQIKPGSDVLSDCHSSAGPRSLQEVGAVVGAMVDVVVEEDARSLQEVGAVLGAMVDVVVEEYARSLQEVDAVVGAGAEVVVEEDARSLQEVDAVVGAGAEVVVEEDARSLQEVDAVGAGAEVVVEEDARSLQEVDAVVGAGADVVEEGGAVSVAEPLKLVEPQNNMGEVEQQGDVEELPLAAPHQQRNIISR
ncbi:hypothetical protein GPALN_003220 [Globodera pallida]|nr:hypothetical protein GPALN_003220 [Globodera pallida]